MLCKKWSVTFGISKDKQAGSWSSLFSHLTCNNESCCTMLVNFFMLSLFEIAWLGQLHQRNGMKLELHFFS